MRWYKSSDGEDRIWFDREEIESIAEGELRKAGLIPSVEAPVVDIEQLIESHLRVRLDQHAALDPDVLGVTEFPRNGPPEISINKDLTNSALDAEVGPPGRLGRWRATLAHEACHVLLHQVLFDLNPNQGVIFDSASHNQTPGLMRCLKREVTFVSEVPDWREVQANRGMAALLMPRSIFLELARSEFDRLDIATGTQANLDLVRRVTATLAARLDVSRQAASIRLRNFGFVESGTQPTLEVS